VRAFAEAAERAHALGRLAGPFALLALAVVAQAVERAELLVMAASSLSRFCYGSCARGLDLPARLIKI